MATVSSASSASTGSALVAPEPLDAGSSAAVAATPVGAGTSGASPAVRTPVAASRSTPTSPSDSRTATGSGASPAAGTSSAAVAPPGTGSSSSSGKPASATPGGASPAGATAAGATAYGRDSVHRLASGRTYELHSDIRVTPAYRGSARPLVIMLHGLLNNADLLRQASSADSFADAHDFAVAYGVGVHEAWNAGGCCGNVTTDDVAYVRQIVADVARFTPVDRSRVYVWGFSNGGMLAARIACEAPDLVAAVGMVGGQALVSCPDVPVNMVHIHGTADATVPWRGGWSDYLTMFLPDGETEASHFAPGSTIRHVLWDGGHTWPWWSVGALWDFCAPFSLDATAAATATAPSAAPPADGSAVGSVIGSAVGVEPAGRAPGR